MSTENEKLIAEARKAQSADYLATEKPVAEDLSRIVAGLADALESVRAERDAALADKTYWHEVATKAKDQRDAAVAALERVRALHRKFTYYELEDSCPDTSENHREERHHESDEIGEFYCEDMPTGDVVCDLCRDADGERMDWPCETIQALDGAPEPEGRWEYRARTDYGRVVAQGSLDEIGYLSGHIWERRRPAGPWLPVEGEKP